MKIYVIKTDLNLNQEEIEHIDNLLQQGKDFVISMSPDKTFEVDTIEID